MEPPIQEVTVFPGRDATQGLDAYAAWAACDLTGQVTVHAVI